MKKIFILGAILLIISGCSFSGQSKQTLNEKSVSESANSFDDSELNSKVNNMKKNQSSSATPNKATEEQQQQAQLEDLASQFNQAIIKTNFGDIKIAFYNNESPITVNNFLNLAQEGFYDNTKFHRVIKDFMIQGGDPNSKDDDWSNDGTGGPDYKFQDEFNDHKLIKGSLAMANSGPNTNGSQFFIVTAEATPWLDNKHTNFGYVLEGMDVIEKIEAVEVNERDHPVEDVVVEGIELIKTD